LSRLEQLRKLNQMLLSEQPQYREQATDFPLEPQSQWRLFRSLVNVREPKPIDRAFLELQDNLLKEMIAERGITKISSLIPLQENIYLWQGDITTLQVDGIVNAANSGMTGCYCPCHGCIDNAIHTFAGVQLRLECAAIIKEQGYPEPTGKAKITKAYNLPCQFVLHTVGPIVTGKLSKKDCALLASCYQSCLELAEQNHLKSLAFCCISTGEFHFPNHEAAEIAVKTVKEFLSTHTEISVVFNVFKDGDYEIYRKLLS
jgi:O-acetyl-ADP-ribose deacetylase (regulator of RNase III)